MGELGLAATHPAVPVTGQWRAGGPPVAPGARWAWASVCRAWGFGVDLGGRPLCTIPSPRCKEEMA